jgi:hypothetical protein
MHTPARFAGSKTDEEATHATAIDNDPTAHRPCTCPRQPALSIGLRPLIVN